MVFLKQALRCCGALGIVGLMAFMVLRPSLRPSLAQGGQPTTTPLPPRAFAPLVLAALRPTPTVGPTAVPGGTEYFVATNGDDQRNPGTQSLPWRTIQKAVNTIQPGDSIVVRAGTYQENITIRRPATASRPMTLRAFAGERPVIVGSGSGPTVYFYHSLCDEDVIGNGSGNTDCQALYWELRGFRIQGSPAGGGDGNVVKIDTPKVTLRDNLLCCSVADVVKIVRTANDAQILSNEIWQDSAIVTPGANAQGVDIVGADRVRVAGNHIHDINDIGVYAKGNARNALFENNRLVNIGVNALMLGQSTDAERLRDGNYESYDGIVRNNVVVNSGWACLATASSFNAQFYNNSCYLTGQSSQASIRLSNESEVEQAGAQITIVNNLIYGSSATPVIKIGSNSLSDYSTLAIHHNLYFVSGGNPLFYASDFFEPVGFAQWKTNYAALTGRSDASSLVADPQFASISGANALSLQAGSPAINAGVNASAVPADRLGVPRPQGPSTDIGAYEQ
ncbi:MAG TPA: choice-of-anchor Q domain-containing protein [Herpetosiphonaceae bacterium]